MSMRRSARVSTLGRIALLAIASFLTTAGASLADTAVNTHTTGDQSQPTIAVDGQGRFIVAWVSDGQDGDGLGVFVQRFNVNGQPIGNEFPINTYTTGDQSEPHVAANADGDFIVIWKGRGGAARNDVRGRRFNAAGLPIGTEFQINESTTLDRHSPAVALANDGSFIALWTGSTGTDARHFDHNTAPTTGDFKIANNQPAVYNHIFTHHDAEALPDGDFILNWHSYYSEGFGTFWVSSYLFDPDTAQGSGFSSGPTVLDADIEPSLALTPDGGFVLAWSRFAYGGVANGRTFGRRYSTNGAPQGDFLSPLPTNPATRVEDIAAVGADRFLVVWDEAFPVPEVRGRHLDLDGTPLTDTFTISNGPVDADGDLVAASFGRRKMVVWTEDQGLPAQQEVVATTRFPLFSDGFEGGDTAAWSAALSLF